MRSEFFRANAPIPVVKEHLTLLNYLRSEHEPLAPTFGVRLIVKPHSRCRMKRRDYL